MSSSKFEHAPRAKTPTAGLAAMALAGALAVMPLVSTGAKPASATASTQESSTMDLDGLPTCAPPRGTPEDGSPQLRLAAVPMSFQLMSGTAMQGVIYRLTGPVPAAAASAANANPMAKAMFGSPLPKHVRLIDGSVDLHAGRGAKAEAALRECAAMAAKDSDSLLEAACANNLGLALAAQGRIEQGRVELERALRLYRREPSPPPDLGAAMPFWVNPYQAPLQSLAARLPPEMRQQYERQMAQQVASAKSAMAAEMLKRWQHLVRLDTSRGVERTTLNLGNLALLSGRLGDAESLLNSALATRLPGEPPQCDTAAAVDLARLQLRLGRQSAARDVMKGRDAKAVAAVDEAYAVLIETGAIRLAAAAGGTTSPVVAAAAVPVAALAPGAAGSQKDALTLSYGEAGSRFDGTVLSRLQDDATRAAGTPAVALWRRIGLRSAAGHRPDLEFAAHAALLNIHVSAQQRDAAIHHGKRAANLAQAVRSDLADKTPTREARRAFMRERRQVYVALAQLLLDAQRLQEAESVLQLLKEDEGQQFVDAPSALGSVALTAAEQTIQRRDADTARRLGEAEQARFDAAARLPIGANAFRMFDEAALEKRRLASGLGLASLATRWRQSPPRVQRGDPFFADAKDFFVGPGGRLDRFVGHLIDDAPSFDPPASPAELARLRETARRLPQIKSELAPALNAPAVQDGPTVTMNPGGRGTSPASADDDDDLKEPNHYLFAEPAENMWRAMRLADTVETQHAQLDDERALQAAASTAGQPPRSVPGDTVALLAQQAVPTALLYYLPSAQRVDALVVSAQGRQHVRLAVTMGELDAGIQAFFRALRERETDPTGAAQAMYRHLFAPVASAVAASGARVLALSLAGALRFVPFAALHDERGWLVERYAIAIHPGPRLAGQLKPTTPNWRVAAFGASLGAGEFAPLLNVRSEIGSVVRQDGGAGALPGNAWLDGAFTAEQLRTALRNGPQVVHIASHFKFVGGDAAASYLLLGDGGHLTLRDLAGPQYRFDRTELVTLSACTTGVSADDAYGQEVDGLAALLMGQGAPSVLASLWDVDDRSTATLMAAVYRLREAQRLSRATALQQAQIAMIRAAAVTAASAPTARAAAAEPARSVSRIRLPDDPAPDPAQQDASAARSRLGYAHPFYWAAFVLIGNWL